MPTILLVDDSKEYRDATQEFLEMEGHSVVLAENGAVALSLIPQSQPDLILSDGNMPVMTGIELLQAIRADEQLKATPFVLVTGRSELLHTARSLGADAALLKSVAVEEFLAILNKLLKS